MKTPIKIKNMSYIQTINHIMTQYPFDIWLHSDSGQVNAKSLLGIFALSLNETLYLVIDEDEDTSKLFEELSPYIDFVEKE